MSWGDRLHSGLVIIKPGHDLELTLPSTFRVVKAENRCRVKAAWKGGQAGCRIGYEFG